MSGRLCDCVPNCVDHSFIRNSLSYDLDLDTRLSEETTVLVESYTVCHPRMP